MRGGIEMLLRERWDDSITPVFTAQLFHSFTQNGFDHTGTLAGYMDTVDGSFSELRWLYLSIFLFSSEPSSCEGRRRFQPDTRSRSQKPRPDVQLAGRQLVLHIIGYCSIVSDGGRKWRKAV